MWPPAAAEKTPFRKLCWAALCSLAGFSKETAATGDLDLRVSVHSYARLYYEALVHEVTEAEQSCDLPAVGKLVM